MGGLRRDMLKRIEAAMAVGRIRRSPYLGFADDMHFWKDRIEALI